jgi:hypothetical protein
VFWALVRWAGCYQMGSRGWIMADPPLMDGRPADLREIADRLRLSLEQCQEDVAALVDCRLVEWAEVPAGSQEGESGSEGQRTGRGREAAAGPAEGQEGAAGGPTDADGDVAAGESATESGLEGLTQSTTAREVSRSAQVFGEIPQNAREVSRSVHDFPLDPTPTGNGQRATGSRQRAGPNGQDGPVGVMGAQEISRRRSDSGPPGEGGPPRLPSPPGGPVPLCPDSRPTGNGQRATGNGQSPGGNGQAAAELARLERARAARAGGNGKPTHPTVSDGGGMQAPKGLGPPPPTGGPPPWPRRPPGDRPEGGEGLSDAAMRFGSEVCRALDMGCQVGSEQWALEVASFATFPERVGWDPQAMCAAIAHARMIATKKRRHCPTPKKRARVWWHVVWTREHGKAAV